MPWRDGEGNVVGGSYRSWIDRQIAAAEERGDSQAAGDALYRASTGPRGP
ncbi:MAG TPA: hypothetical protein VFR23_05370 [Jiangellaceae bacterium]|nr:hypothetical protein [Jiangellaceae bacterium]